MSIGRRKARLDDESAWVFNRMVDAYRARPAYPSELVDRLGALASGGARVLDLGAGLGHLAIPLAERGYRVTAVEPAVGMLQALRREALGRSLAIESVQAMAEALPFEAESFDLVVAADVVHFLDSERAAREVARVLAPSGALGIVSCAFADEPFMNAVVEIMRDSAPRRPREVSSARTELLAVARVKEPWATRFSDAVAVDEDTLERILRSVSFIGPAMNEKRFARFWQRIRAIPHTPRWARTFVLEAGRRGAPAP